jgi:ABC-type multidrug transport system ATPase subunit
VTVITLHQVSKRYGDRIVLRPLDLAIRGGESIVVHGANGSGKSTLMRMIAGVSRPTSGTVDGIPERVGYLPERFRPPSLMRADVYLRHVGRIGHLNATTARQRIDSLSHILGIRPSVNERLGRLSKGNLQKIGIAQVFLPEHRLIVLDEPRTGLERAAWPALDELISNAVQRGAVVISSEHDAHLIESAPRLLRIAANEATVIEQVTALRRVEFVVLPASEKAGELDRMLARFSSVTVEPRTAERDHSVVIWADSSEKDALLLCLLTNGWTVNRLRLDGDRG